MHERMLNKSNIPTTDMISDYVGNESLALISKFEQTLNTHYDLRIELKFPFGKNYGWGYKYSSKAKHLCYLFFEKESFTITIQIGDGKAVESILGDCLPKTKELWDKRYPCSNGGWVHYRVSSEDELNDILKLIAIKKKPIIQN